MKLSRYISFIASMLFAASSAHAAVELASSPLQTGGEVAPNIMFIIDDSGSMNREYMPDNISGYYKSGTKEFCNRRDGGRCTRTGTYYDAEQVYYPWYYSSKVNGVYFDPNGKYEIPLKSDGVTSWGEPSFNNAWDNGFTQTSRSDLRDDFSHRGRRYYNGAFYYQYDADLDDCDDDDQYDNDCYKYVHHSDMSEDIKKKFAIWYSYYRDRLQASKSSISTAFHQQSGKLRVGYGAINKTSSYQGVAPFNGSARTGFFNWLFDVEASGNTPLRYALDKAGQYYKTEHPWRTEPEERSSDMLSCRQSFSIIMTDGYWNSSEAATSGARKNNDNTDGLLLTNESGASGKYTKADPFKDGYDNTLADVAMYYWKNDLMPSLDNNVPTSEGVSPAFWQHMRVFGISLGLSGDVSPDDAMNAITTGDSIDWGNPFSDGPAKIDDLLHAAVNSRGGFFTAKDPTEFAEKLSATLKGIDQGVASASNLAGTTTSTQADNYVYQGSYNGNDWSGTLSSYDITNPSAKIWSANFPEWNTRNLLFTGESGVKSFNWSNLSESEKNALKSKDLVNYLRGETINEAPASVNFRKRSGLLGDIANSSPHFVAAPINRNFGRYNWLGANSYNAFIANNKTREGRLYVGANDGFLHAFDAANGTETFAYMPKAMLKESTNLASYADPFYEHKYFVDGSPVAADVYVGGWKTILVGSLGRGGNSLFALDITNPNSMTTSNVLWDKSYSDLGVITTKPSITRLNNGSWAVVVGYGYNNATKGSGLLVIDIANGDVLANIAAPDTVDENAHGLGQVEGWDADRDGTTDWFFAGDLLGNVWKFDLSSNIPSEWKVAYAGFPLFRAKNDLNQAQPITGGLTLSSEPKTGQLWLFFGTGKMLAAADLNNAEVQSWYGIQDVAGIIDRSKLKKREMQNVVYTDATGSRESRTVTEATENDMAGKLGWYMDLIDGKERIVTRPVQAGNNLVVSTAIPSGDDCKPAGDGYVMSIDPFKGARLKYHFFDLSKDGKFDGADGINSGDSKIPASGIKFDGTPSEPVLFEDKMAIGLATATIAVEGYNGGIRRGRVSWRELTN
ncbi:pilus assembly protein [Rheinheimera sp. WS51]|uniref:pilus assembly protein n=1 Tax=Rheinheimera sp. WS51 TaxID=3425886 RepID=UPI003D8FD778